ncbi:MAG: MotA/TolQ/ExbB proton channel family protein [Planctomycetia bacterium]|nr:MotA/TolQ/ExbB proton channel family protein [Planctomycetia bacterium]
MKFLNTMFDHLFRQPLLWGLAAGFLFCTAVRQGPLHSPFFLRYTQGHWILQVEIFLFCGAMAVLVARLMDTARHRRHLRRYVTLGPLTRRVEGRPDDYLPRRLRDVTQMVRRSPPDQIDVRLSELSDRDSQYASAAYGLVRLVVWAIPIFGFLGTVIGITLAIAQLNGNALEESMPQVTEGLGVAFDTTAVALSLSMILKFVQFYASRRDSALLSEIDTLVTQQIQPDGESALTTGPVGDPSELAKRYEAFFAAARQEWERMVHSAGVSLSAQATEIVGSQLNSARTELTRQISDFSRQMDAIVRLTSQLDVIARTESELNRNLASLAEARHFEQTVTSLAAAIQLLSVRLGDLPTSTPTSIPIPTPTSVPITRSHPGPEEPRRRVA